MLNTGMAGMAEVRCFTLILFYIYLSTISSIVGTKVIFHSKNSSTEDTEDS